MGEYNEMNIGDVVSASGQLGRVSDPKGNVDGSKFRVTYRFPVRFPGRKLPLWFAAGECRFATETERKHHFKECILGRRIKT